MRACLLAMRKSLKATPPRISLCRIAATTERDDATVNWLKGKNSGRIDLTIFIYELHVQSEEYRGDEDQEIAERSLKRRTAIDEI